MAGTLVKLEPVFKTGLARVPVGYFVSQMAGLYCPRVGKRFFRYILIPVSLGLRALDNLRQAGLQGKRSGLENLESIRLCCKPLLAWKWVGNRNDFIGHESRLHHKSSPTI